MMSIRYDAMKRVVRFSRILKTTENVHDFGSNCRFITRIRQNNERFCCTSQANFLYWFGCDRISQKRTNSCKDQLRHSSSNSVPENSAEKVLELVHSFQKTEILIQAVTFGIFDILCENEAGMDVQQLSDILQTVPDMLERFLNSCASLGLIVRFQQDNKVLFKNSPLGEVYLTKKSPNSLVGLVQFVKAMKSNYNLETPITTGKALHMLQSTGSGREKSGSVLYDHEQENKRFVMGFEAANAAVSKTSYKMLSELELGRFEKTVDLGGSLGVISRELKRLNRDMDVTLADLPPVIQHARKIPENIEVDLNYAECDFFKKETLPEANLYVLAHVLPNWSDDNCAIIVKNVYDSLSTGGSMLVLDNTLNDNMDGPVFVNQHDLLYMMFFEGGKHRSFQQLKVLLESQGFKDITISKHPSSPYYDAIKAYK